MLVFKNMAPRRLLSLLALLTAVSPVLADEYFVSNSDGADTNDGTSAATPWQSLERVAEANFSPGDVIRFKRGDVWRGQLNINADGRKGEPVTFTHYGDAEARNPLVLAAIKLDDWQSGGDGLYAAKVDSVPHHVVIRLPDGRSLKMKRNGKGGRDIEEGQFSWKEQEDGSHYLYVRHPALGTAGAYADAAAWDHAISGRGKYVVLDGIDGEVSQWANIYVRGEGKPWVIKNLSVRYGWGSNRRTPGGGIEVRSLDGTVIDNVTVRDSHGDGIYVRCSNTTVQNSRIYTVYKGFNPGGDCIQFSSARTDGFKILNNWMTQKGTDTPKGCIQQEFGDNGVVRGNIISYGVFGLEVNGNNIVVEDNIVLFPGVDRKGQDPFSAGIYMSEHRGYDNILIRNNIVYGADQNAIGLEATNGRKFPPYNRTNIGIYNNTIINANRSGVRTTVPFSGEIKNNIFWNTGRAVDIASIVFNHPFEMSHNLVQEDGGTLIAIGNEQWPTIAEFQAATGKGQFDFSADPKLAQMDFPRIPDPQPDSPVPNFRPTADSPVIDRGVFVGYREDITGATVPQGNRVDVGAYESGFSRFSPPEPVAPVERLSGRALSQDEIRLDWTGTDPEAVGYFVHRSVDTGAAPSPDTLVRPLVDTPPFFDIGALDFGQSYRYQVAAVNAAGRPSEYRDVDIATLAPPEGFIAYEPFDYQTNTVLEGKTGGVGFGGPWDSDGPAKITEGSIGREGVSTNGKAVQFWDSHRRPLAERLVPTAEEPLWIGAIFGASHSSKYAQLKFLDGEATAFQLHVRPDESVGIAGATTDQAAGKSPAFYAIRLSLNAGGGTEVALWMDPDTSADDPGAPHATATLDGVVGIDALALYFSHGSDHKGEIDEIRIGRRFQNTFTSRVADEIPPAAPEGLSGESIGTSRVRLTWIKNRESDVSHYALLRDTAPDFAASLDKVVANEIEAADYLDMADIQPGTTYYYRVAAIDTSGNYSEVSDPAAVTVADATGTLLLYEPFSQKEPSDPTGGGFAPGSEWTFSDPKDSGFSQGSRKYPGIETNGGKISVVGSASRDLAAPLAPEPGKPLWIGFVMEERNSGRDARFVLNGGGESVLTVYQKPNQEIKINGEGTGRTATGGFQFFLVKLEAEGGSNRAAVWIDPDLEAGEPPLDAADARLSLSGSGRIDGITISHYPASLFSVYVDEIRMGRTFTDAIQGSRVSR